MLADTGRIDVQLVPLLIPYALAPLVFSVLLGRHLGLFGAVLVSLWGGEAPREHLMPHRMVAALET